MINKEKIIAALKASKSELSELGVKKVGLFGSYSRNEQTKMSDIDLLVDFDPAQETFDNFMAVYDVFEKIFKDQKVEMVTKNGLSKHIGPKILKTALYV